MLKAVLPIWRGARRFLTPLALALMASHVSAQTGMVLYDDALENSWANWSWSSTIDLGNTSIVHSGSKSIAVTITAGYGALYLEHSALNSGSYSNLNFWINGGPTGGQQLQVTGHAGGAQQLSTNLAALAANTWQLVSIPLSALGVANRPDLDGLWVWDRINAAQPTFYVDDMMLSTNSIPPPTVTLSAPTNGATFGAPATINLAASVVTNSHSINQVQFYNGATLLGQAAAPPYSYAWTGVGAGTYGLLARVIYDSSNHVDSPTANVTVTGTIAVSIAVDAQLNRHPISPLIYGVAFASAAQLSDLNFTLNRSGGNEETTYNWQLNAHGKGADWYFESYPDSSATPGASADSFVAASKSGGAQSMITVPMIGWAPMLGPGRSIIYSYAVSKYGPQKSVDPYRTDAGNGISVTNSTPITWNNPNDANFPTNTAFEETYVQHLIGNWGLSTNGGVGYYLMDNEHSIWHSTHQDVHPVGATMQEIWTDMLATASMVKSNDPNALVLGPEEWGWNGYLYSGYDQQWSGKHGDYNPAHYPDRAANGGWDYMPWLLDQFHQHEISTGQRLLDYFTLHCYPQENGVGGNGVSSATQLLRNQSTRQFWDTNYVDPSWINSVIMLIPRMKSWAATYYPGTKTGITEYNWGAESAINGATAQADLLGIFGWQGLDLATRWTTPSASTPTYLAMKMYRNYDGHGSTFGDTSVSASGPNPDNVATFAAVRSADGALTLMVINKQLTSAAALTLNITNFSPAGTAQAWQLTSANSISRLADITLSGNTLATTVPVQSVTLFIVPPGAVTPPPPVLVPPVSGLSSSNTFNFWLVNGVPGQRYVILSSPDLGSWSPVQTNTLTTSSNSYALPASAALRFYRAQWLP
jgi:hypothetical protein